jgi:hypothetical protein
MRSTITPDNPGVQECGSQELFWVVFFQPTGLPDERSVLVGQVCAHETFVFHNARQPREWSVFFTGQRLREWVRIFRRDPW